MINAIEARHKTIQSLIESPSEELIVVEKLINEAIKGSMLFATVNHMLSNSTKEYLKVLGYTVEEMGSVLDMRTFIRW